MKKRYIVWCDDYNGHAANFMMDHDDDRLGDGYEKVDEIASLSTYQAGGINDAGSLYRIAIGISGRQYEVYSDWSVRMVEVAA